MNPICFLYGFKSNFYAKKKIVDKSTIFSLIGVILKLHLFVYNPETLWIMPKNHTFGQCVILN